MNKKGSFKSSVGGEAKFYSSVSAHCLWLQVWPLQFKKLSKTVEQSCSGWTGSTAIEVYVSSVWHRRRIGRGRRFLRKMRKQVREISWELQQMAALRRDQTDTVKNSKENIVHSVSKAYAFSVYSRVRLDFLRSVNETVFWQESVVDASPSFVDVLQIYTNMTALSSKSTATVVYPVHVVLLNVSMKFRRFLTDQRYTLIVLLSVATSRPSTDAEDTVSSGRKSDFSLSAFLPPSDELPLTSSRGATDMMLMICYEAMHETVRSQKDNVRQDFQVLICRKPWTWHPPIASYCFATSLRKICPVWNRVCRCIFFFDVWGVKMTSSFLRTALHDKRRTCKMRTRNGEHC